MSQIEEQLREALVIAREKLLEQKEVIEELTNPPFTFGTVLVPPSKGADGEYDSKGSNAVIATSDSIIEIATTEELRDQLTSGKVVKLNSMGAPIEVLPSPLPVGSIVTVRSSNEEFCEIDQPDGLKAILPGENKVEVGDRVIVDSTGSIVLKNLGKKDEEYLFTNETNVSWDDIGGLHSAKEQMKEAIELPYLHPEIYAKYNKKPIKGILLYGPPGCGKTMIGMAASTSLAKIHGREVSTGFIYVKGPEVLDKYVGETESKIRQLFRMAREHKEQHGYPAILFIDEADALLGRRGSGISSDVNKTIVPTFLAEMDGLNESGAMTLFATNRPDTLDPAIVREGRVDRKIMIGRPDKESTRAILAIHFRNKPRAKGFSENECLDLAVEEVFSAGRLFKKRGGPVIMSSVINGAMLAAVAEHAASFAIKRDLSTGKFKGITRKDIRSAVDRIQQQNADINLSDIF